MVRNNLTLTLDGDVHIEDLEHATANFGELIRKLTAEISRDMPIGWIVADLNYGSASVTVRGEAENPEPVEQVVRAYEVVGEALQSHSDVPYSPAIVQPAKRLAGLIDGRITSIRFETDQHDFIVYESTTQKPSIAVQPVYGAIEGRIQTITSRQSLRFTLYDSLNDKAISCYLQEGNEDIIRGLWDRRAIVEGIIYRDPETGRARTIRNIERVTPVEDPGPGMYRRARGASPHEAEGPMPEDVIRKLRDAV